MTNSPWECRAGDLDIGDRVRFRGRFLYLESKGPAHPPEGGETEPGSFSLTFRDPEQAARITHHVVAPDAVYEM